MMVCDMFIRVAPNEAAVAFDIKLLAEPFVFAKSFFGFACKTGAMVLLSCVMRAISVEPIC